MKLIIMILVMLAITSPVWAADGEPSTIPWSTIITLGLVILTGVAGGIIGAMRKALKSSFEALKIISDALDDNLISDDEIKLIVAGAVNCQSSWKDVIKRVGELLKKSHKV